MLDTVSDADFPYDSDRPFFEATNHRMIQMRVILKVPVFSDDSGKRFFIGPYIGYPIRITLGSAVVTEVNDSYGME